MDSFQIDENSILESIICLSLTLKNLQFSTWHLFNKKYDNYLKNVGIQIAFNNT